MLEPLTRAVAALDQISSETVNMLRAPDPQATAATTRTPALKERPDKPGIDASASRSGLKASGPLSTTRLSARCIRPPRSHKTLPATVAPGKPVAAAHPQAAPAAVAAGSPHASERERRIHTALAQMLDRLSALPELRPAISALHDRTFNDLSSDELAERLERVTNLIGEQRTSLLREKGEIEDMLRQIDSRLEAISAFFAFEDQERSNARDNSKQLNELVMGEVNDISTT